MPDARPRIPPLAGVASYREAAQTGLSVDHNVTLLKRYAYIERRLMEIALAHLNPVPEWEVKCALSLHCWLDAEHATMFRQRIGEMREPPLHLDVAPDARLASCLDEALNASTTAELLVGVYGVLKPALLAAYRRHLEATNRLMDYPTVRLLRLLLIDEEEMITWAEAALAALEAARPGDGRAESWAAHLQAYLDAAGGVWGDGAAGAALPPPRSTGAYVPRLYPQRDARFEDRFNFGGDIDAIARDPAHSPQERTVALMWKRLREMDVPELMAGFLVRTPDKPWDYYRDMTRQLWDEARHAMMGEAFFESRGIDWTAFPVPINTAYLNNLFLDALESHATLYDTEQGLMRRETGKRAEWETSRAAGDPYVITAQDYDWADEVLHVQFGRRWLVPTLGDRDRISELVAAAQQKKERACDDDPRLDPRNQAQWWPGFYASLRRDEQPEGEAASQ